jgi:ubiquinone/menaquinone biosynthesis C-methylase UbiE
MLIKEIRMKWYERFYRRDFMEVVGFASAQQTEKEVNFVKDALNCPKNAKILDLCCGYGRHTYLLAKSGNYHMTGLDLSDHYLDIAGTKFSHPQITYVKGDMRNIPYENYFDAVINLFTSFGFFDRDEENETVIKQVYKALKPGGMFLLDYENKFYFVYNDVFRKERYWEKISKDKYLLFENEFDAEKEREVFKVHVLEKGILKETSGYNIRLYSFPEIKKMLAGNQFEIIRTWGDYRGNRYSAHSKRLIILSRSLP